MWEWFAGQALPGMDSRKVRREGTLLGAKSPHPAAQPIPGLSGEVQRELERAVAAHAEMVKQLSQIKVQIPKEWKG